MAKIKNNSNDISRWVSYVIPMISLVIVLLAPLLPFDIYENWYLSEKGFIEVGTFVFLILAIILAIRVLRHWKNIPRWIGPWMLFIALASVFFAGEEIDWGQVWFNISTPSVIEDVNRNGQFCLHKIDGHWLPRILFNLGPRLIATILMIFCVISPWLIRKINWLQQHKRNKSLLYWILPTATMVPISLLAVLSTVPSKIIKSLNSFSVVDVHSYVFLAFRKPGGEFKEYCVALAILLYVWSLHSRLYNQFKK